MTTLLLYSYTQGVFSSRRIMKRCQRDAAYRVIVHDDAPDFRTISDFRKLHLAELEGLFVQVLRLCQEAGLVKLGHVSLDGTKVKANASRHKAMSYGRMKEEEKRLRKEIRDLLNRAEATDAEEDERYGRDLRGDELPEELSRRESRLKRIREARKALENKARAAAEEERKRREEEDRKRRNKPRKGRQRQDVKDVPDDKKQLQPLVKQAKKNIGRGRSSTAVLSKGACGLSDAGQGTASRTSALSSRPHPPAERGGCRLTATSSVSHDVSFGDAKHKLNARSV